MSPFFPKCQFEKISKFLWYTITHTLVIISCLKRGGIENFIVRELETGRNPKKLLKNNLKTIYNTMIGKNRLDKFKKN